MSKQNCSPKPIKTEALDLIIAIPVCNAATNDARLRELEHAINCAGGGGGFSGYDYTRRLFRCPSYGQN